jgi:hypothetical protein
VFAFEISEPLLQILPEGLQYGIAPGKSIQLGLDRLHAAGENVDRDAGLAA